MCREEMEAISELANWFPLPDGTYLRVFGGNKPPHQLPRYANDKMIMEDVDYHISVGFSGVLQRKKKAPWPTLPL